MSDETPAITADSSGIYDDGATYGPPQGDQSFLLTVDEIAAQLRVTKMTVYRQIKAGRLGALRVGTSYRVPEAEFAAYKKRNTMEAAR